MNFRGVEMKILIFLFLISCGSDHEHNDPAPQQPPARPPSGGGNSGGGGKPSYAQVQGLLNNYCAACHSNAQFMGSEAALRSSTALNRVRARTMPPPNAGKKLPDRERGQILSFF